MHIILLQQLCCSSNFVHTQVLNLIGIVKVPALNTQTVLFFILHYMDAELNPTPVLLYYKTYQLKDTVYIHLKVYHFTMHSYCSVSLYLCSSSQRVQDFPLALMGDPEY